MIYHRIFWMLWKTMYVRANQNRNGLFCGGQSSGKGAWGPRNTMAFYKKALKGMYSKCTTEACSGGRLRFHNPIVPANHIGFDRFTFGQYLDWLDLNQQIPQKSSDVFSNICAKSSCTRNQRFPHRCLKYPSPVPSRRHMSWKFGILFWDLNYKMHQDQSTSVKHYWYQKLPQKVNVLIKHDQTWSENSKQLQFWGSMDASGACHYLDVAVYTVTSTPRPSKRQGNPVGSIWRRCNMMIWFTVLVRPKGVINTSSFSRIRCFAPFWVAHWEKLENQMKYQGASFLVNLCN